MQRLRVLVVDDHHVVHWGLRLLLGGQPWVERCVSAHNGAEALALAGRHQPHVALVDLFIGPEWGAELCQALRATSPGTRVLLMSGSGRMSPTSGRALGASGFISKDWAADDVVSAVRLVGAGLTLFEADAQPRADELSPRDRQVLDLIAAGATNTEIAARLLLSPHTVKEYASRLYRRLGARNRAEAVHRARSLGLLV
jgi:DNA-binding NarL/FixJ family response regulator